MPCAYQLEARFVGRLALHQRLGLGQVVREQDRVVIAPRVMALSRGQEIARDQLGALVDQLVEGMLAVGARLPQMIGPVV